MYEILNSSMSRRAALRRLTAVMGGIATAPLASGLLGGCTAPTGEEAAGYAYQVLNTDQQRAVAALVDQIIPVTDTPGAAGAGVPQFVDMMLADWYAPEERDDFLAGLAAFDARAQTEYGAAFADLENDTQYALVAALDAATFGPMPDDEVIDGDVVEAGQEGSYKDRQEEDNLIAGMQGDLGDAMDDESAPDGEGAGSDVAEMGGGGGGDSSVRPPSAPIQVNPDAPPFFVQAKELTVAGYYTSQIGASQELRWNPAPGRYDPDVPFEEIGRAWA